MSGRPLTIPDIGRLCGIDLPAPPGKAKCPFAKHKKRKDKTFRTFIGKDGTHLAKCWSCADGPGGTVDAVGLYAKLAGIDRRAAWKKLKDDGYAVPGASDDGERRQESRPRQPERPRIQPPTMPRPAESLVLDPAKLAAWRGRRSGDLERLAAARHLPLDVLRGQDVVEIAPGVVGFVYVDPYTGVPCRVKARPLAEKRFWIEPRGEPTRPGVKALAPLYLAHALGSEEIAVIVEGEIDALSLVAMGVRNVVSLPDGASSAADVDLRHLLPCRVWLIATDGDADGEKAHATLVERAKLARVRCARVRWTGLGGLQLKDANDALCAGFRRADFVACLNAAAKKDLGVRVYAAA